jgi:hypothetical protein
MPAKDFGLKGRSFTKPRGSTHRRPGRSRRWTSSPALPTRRRGAELFLNSSFRAQPDRGLRQSLLRSLGHRTADYEALAGNSESWGRRPSCSPGRTRRPRQIISTFPLRARRRRGLSARVTA